MTTFPVARRILLRWTYAGIRLAASITAIAALTTCGLEVLISIDAPRSDLIEDQGPALPVVSFVHNNSFSNQQDEFLGYEIWYKFYDDLGETDISSAPFPSDLKAVTDPPLVFGPSRLSARGFRRMQGRQFSGGIPGSLLPQPIISIVDKASADRITITFQVSQPFGPEDQPQVYWPDVVSPPNIAVLERFVDGFTAKSFFPLEGSRYQSVVQGDDIPATLPPVPPSTTGRTFDEVISDSSLAIGMFVLAYGRNLQTFSVIYSEPVKLSYARLQ